MQQSQWPREETSESSLEAMTPKEPLVADYAVSRVMTERIPCGFAGEVYWSRRPIQKDWPIHIVARSLYELSSDRIPVTSTKPGAQVGGYRSTM